jgi:beta-lactamase class A
MLDRLRAATMFVALMLVLSACAGSEAQATAPQPTRAIAADAPTTAPTTVPTAVPTNTPAPTAVPTLAKGVIVAGVDVGGLTPEEARKKLERELAPLLRPLDVQAGEKSITIKPEAIDLQLPFDDLLSQADAAKSGDSIDLSITYDAAKLRTALSSLGQPAGSAPSISVISSTKTISRSFALSGAGLDLDAAVKQIDERLHAVGGARRLTLAPASGAALRPTPAQLQEQIEAIAKQWKGIAGVYVYDLASGQEIASLNKNTVFSAASTIKIAILLNAYVHLGRFTAKQEQALEKMIVNSDNLAANTILAASVGGTGTEDALRGAEQMSATLKQLGLSHTYLYVPFEATEYLAQKKVKYKLGPKRDGDAPYTDSGRALRATPAEMAQIYVLIDQCSQGQGALIETFGKHLNAKRCQEMLDRLNENGDKSRMRSGLPNTARVEHKSGWIDDMQADVGIVRSPGGDFVIATYLFRATNAALPDKLFQPFLGGLARLVYSYYNPVLVNK